MKTILEVLMERDGMSKADAKALIDYAKKDLQDRLMEPDLYGDPHEICYDHFGLEPDFIMDLI